MPVETTEQYVRVRVREPGDFQAGSFRTVSIDESAGIKAVMGRLQGSTSMTAQSYLFDKEKWSESEATAWVEKHKE